MSKLEERLRKQYPELEEAWDNRIEKLALYRKAVLESQGGTGPGTRASVAGDYFSAADDLYRNVLDAVIKKEVGLDEA